MTYEEAYKKIEDHFKGDEFQSMIVDVSDGGKSIVARNVKEGEPFWTDRSGVEMAVCSYQ